MTERITSRSSGSGLALLARPLTAAVVLADAGRGDWVLCQVTSNPYGDPRALHLTTSSFSSGSLRAESYARPAKPFTASSDLLVSQVATLNADTRPQVVEAAVAILRAREGR